jgi:hypothetical protein
MIEDDRLRLDADYPLILGIGDRKQTNDETFNGQYVLDRVAPLDHGDATFDQLGQVKVECLRQIIESVDIQMMQELSTLVLLMKGERGAGHSIIYAETKRNALRKLGLARTEITGQNDQVTHLQRLG